MQLLSLTYFCILCVFLGLLSTSVEAHSLVKDAILNVFEKVHAFQQSNDNSTFSDSDEYLHLALCL